jgi:hypothetical protein
MHRRARFLVGLVLLVTMGLSIAETVWAATCSPNMGVGSAMASMDGMEGMPGMEHMASMGDVPADDDCMPGHSPEPWNGGDGGPCPFSPAGASQGCVAASLPACGANVATLDPIDMIVAVSAETTPHMLRTASIFHPPKA